MHRPPLEDNCFFSLFFLFREGQSNPCLGFQRGPSNFEQAKGAAQGKPSWQLRIDYVHCKVVLAVHGVSVVRCIFIEVEMAKRDGRHEA